MSSTTHAGSGREGAGSVLASFCISAWRDAAFKLPPEGNIIQPNGHSVEHNQRLTTSLVEGILLGVFGGAFFVNSIDSKLHKWKFTWNMDSGTFPWYLRYDLLTRSLPFVQVPFEHPPSVCICGIDWGQPYNQIDENSLNKCVSFTSPCHGISVKIYKFEFPKGLKDLLNIGFGQVEMQRSNI